MAFHQLPTVLGSRDQEVQVKNRVNIKTKAVGWPSYSYSTSYADHGAHYHGFSIWAPQGFNLNNISNPAITNTQEWEMADDLGDSHCSSLGQGGMLPQNSFSYRIVGKIFSKANSDVTYDFNDDPIVTGVNNCIEFYTLNGERVHCNCSTNDFSGTFVNSSTGWLVIKIRHNDGNGCSTPNPWVCGSNTVATVPAQKAFVKVTYSAPETVVTSNFPAFLANPIVFWTGAANDNDYNNPKNWENCEIPPRSANNKNVIYVNQIATGANNGTNWANAYTSLAVALDNVRNCNNIDEIWVATASYKPATSADRTKSFDLPEGIKIYGGFPNTGNPLFGARNPIAFPTIMSGDIGLTSNSTDNSYHVVTMNTATDTTYVDGFYIRGGNADGSGEFRKGGGLYNLGKLNFKDVFIEECHAFSGSAIHNSGTATSLILHNCTSQNNSTTDSLDVLNINGAKVHVMGTTNIKY